MTNSTATSYDAKLGKHVVLHFLTCVILVTHSSVLFMMVRRTWGVFWMSQGLHRKNQL